MITKSDLEKIDSKSMHKTYDRWPEIAESSYNSKLEKIDLDEIGDFVFVGMGGSGAINELFSSLLTKSKIHVTVVKGYHLPKTVNSKTLVVATSVSGNTDETLSVLDKAFKENCKIVCFASGGKMENYCIKKNISFRKIPIHNSPRASLVAYFYSILRVLESILPIEKHEINESIEMLKEMRDKISSKNLQMNNPAIDLAKWITDIPMIYYPWGLQISATRFKNSLQENAKMHAMAEDMQEACHNGIVSWEKHSAIKPILIQGVDDYIKTKERWGVLKKYFETNNIEYKEIFSVKGNIISKLISLIYFLDYTSIYKAILSNTDPTPVKSIDFIKYGEYDG